VAEYLPVFSCKKKKEADMAAASPKQKSTHFSFSHHTLWYQTQSITFSYTPDPSPEKTKSPSEGDPPRATREYREQRERRSAFDRALQWFQPLELLGSEQAMDYLRHKYRRNHKANSIHSAGITLRSFFSYLQSHGVDRLEDIRRNHLEGYTEQEQDKGLKITSIRSKLEHIYAFFQFLSAAEIIDPELLAKKIKFKLPDMLPRAMDPEDVKRLVSVIDDVRDRALILLLLRTGMRIGELLDLRVTDIDLNERKIMIYLGEKNSRGRVVYYSDDAEEALKAWLRIRDPERKHLFYSIVRKGCSITYVGARRIFTKWLEKAGLAHKGYSLHRLRHTFASELLNAGLRLEVLQQLLGHASIMQTRHYARLTDRTREQEYFHAMALIEKGEIHGNY
jgi:integrase/recombinase XerD